MFLLFIRYWEWYGLLELADETLGLRASCEFVRGE